MNTLKQLSQTIKRAFLNLAILACLLVVSFQSSAADYYWVNGNGNWSDYGGHWATTSGGSIFHITIPTFNDDVYFDGNSFSADSQTVNLDGTFIYCKNMDWSATTYLVKFVSFGSHPVNIYGSCILNQNIYVFDCDLILYGNMNGMIVNAAGVYIQGYIILDGTGSWDLFSDLNCATFTVTSGIFNSNNYSITALTINCSSTNNPTLNMGSSSLHCTSLTINYNPNFFGSDCNVWFDIYPSSTKSLSCFDNTFKNIYFYGYVNEIFGSVSADSIYFYGNGEINELASNDNSINCDYLFFDNYATINSSANLVSLVKKAVFSKGGHLQGETIFDTLTFVNSGDQIVFSGTTIINDTLIFSGSCSLITNIYSSIMFPGTIMKSSGIIEFNYARIENVNATGGATFIANNCFDLGGNSGWQFSQPASRSLFWVNGQGNWTDPIHWSLSSGGPGGNCPPNPVDDVFFDSLSFTTNSDTIVMDQQLSYCNNFHLDAPLTNPVLCVTTSWAYYDANTVLEINGSMQILSAATPLILFKLTSNSIGNIVQTGQSNPYLHLFGEGEWSLAQDITCNSISISQGTFYSNNHNITSKVFSCGRIYPNPMPVVDLGSSTIYCDRFFSTYMDSNLTSQNVNMVFDSTLTIQNWSRFEVNNHSFNNIYFQNDGLVKGSFTCKEMIFEKQDSIILTNATIQKLVINDDSYLQGTINTDTLILATPGKKIETSANINIGSVFEASGISCDTLTSIFSSTFTNLNKTSGSIDLDNVYLENIHATGNATFNATNCIDAGGNTGWNITAFAAREMYWVGGSGSWSDQNNWSLTSGGPGGNCIPNLHDNVFFDNNSFATTGTEIINIDLSEVSCTNFNYDVSYPNKNFNINGNALFYIYGSMILNNKTQFTGSSNYKNSFYFKSDSAINTLLTNETYLNNIIIDGSGDFMLMDSLNCALLSLEEGTFIPGGNSINCSKLDVKSAAVNIDFASDILYCDTLICTNAGPGFISQNLTLQFKIPGTSRIWSNNQEFKNIFAQYLKCFGGFTCKNITAGSFDFDAPDTSQNLTIQTGVFGKITINYASTTFLVNKIVSFDTLILNSAAVINNIRNGIILKIKDTLAINNTPGFPTELKCIPSISGNNFYMEKPNGILCMDNMIMEGVHTSGNANFYAGANSVCIGNCQGWIFSTCNPTNTDVWPGDANYDLTVNNFDVLNVGLGYNAAGPVRPGATNNWVAQPASDWAFQFANGANLKNADCNGDGIISNVDTVAIS
ncbi:MAG: hypothetical protein M3Q95_11915, partial [Bacteroidota bacterium]|nr:hypothetical protein [Bacteroidota bacterium]